MVFGRNREAMKTVMMGEDVESKDQRTREAVSPFRES
jgi:hypothetical protein